jgi:hypothetical protein
VTDEDHRFARVGTASSLKNGGQLISQVVDVVESRSVTVGSTVALEVRRINVRSFGHQPLGDVLVPARVLTVTMSDQRDEPRCGRGPGVNDDPAAAAVELDWFCSRHLMNLHVLVEKKIGLQLALHSPVNR